MSLPIWTFRNELLHEFSVRNAAVIISIESLSDHLQVNLTRIYSILCKNSTQLPLAEVAIVVFVDGKEAFMHVEVRSPLQALAKFFGLLLNREVRPKGTQKHVSRLVIEEMSATESMLNVISRPALHVMSNAFTTWCESITKI